MSDRRKIICKCLPLLAGFVMPAFADGSQLSLTAFSRTQERVPASEAADIGKIVATIEGAVHGAYALGLRPAMRDAHAKGHGCVKATFNVRSDVPAALRQGVLKIPKVFQAWIRFSNGAGAPHDDAAGDGRGMAIKLIGVSGRKLLPQEGGAQTQDFLMIDYPVFFIRNVADYVPFTALSIKGKSSEFFATHRHEYEITKAITARHIHAMLDQRYFSMAPYLLGGNYIKFSARPVDCSTGKSIVPPDTKSPSDPNYLRKGMSTWLHQKDACFVFSVQPQTDAASQPIEDPTILWDERKAPFVDVASIHVPKQAFDSEKQQTFCENLSFTPWHSLPAHRPVGGIGRLRKAVYEAISKLRHELNHAQRSEPAGLETFN